MMSDLFSFEMDQAKVDQFHKAFKDQTKYTPPTIMALAMKGIFQLLNQFQIDWKNLLHASQSFTYHESLLIPSKLHAETKLVTLRFKAQMHWLAFVSEVKTEADQKLLITSKSLLMIK